RDASLILKTADSVDSEALILGGGINLRGAADVNLIENPSFETYLDTVSLTVTSPYDSENGQGVWILASNDEHEDSKRYVSSRYRLLRHTESGQLETVDQGRVSDCLEQLPLTEQLDIISVEG